MKTTRLDSDPTLKIRERTVLSAAKAVTRILPPSRDVPVDKSQIFKRRQAGCELNSRIVVNCSQSAKDYLKNISLEHHFGGA